VGGSLLWFWLLTHGEATRASAWYFLVPVFGLALGALLLGERFGPAALGGLALILAGVGLGSGALRLPRVPRGRFTEETRCPP
jgi:drug/metabolite transporter (DMT)-like permease